MNSFCILQLFYSLVVLLSLQVSSKTVALTETSVPKTFASIASRPNDVQRKLVCSCSPGQYNPSAYDECSKCAACPTGKSMIIYVFK